MSFGPNGLFLALPLAAVLLEVALLPQLAPRVWHDARMRGACLALAAAPAALLDWVWARARLIASAEEYVAFVTLLGCLYVLAGCVRLGARWRATPARNCAVLAVGALLASLVGTTGASMLLVRPLLASNAGRRHVRHTVVFFIFLVSNVGGLLTPLGDPPLFLGYLHGVPFFWTLRLLPAWALTCAGLLLSYAAVEAVLYRREPRPGAQARFAADAEAHAATLDGGTEATLQGGWALGAFVALLALMVAARPLGLPFWPQQLAMWAIAGATFWATPRPLLRRNAFTMEPMLEVAQVFAAIFVAMPAALAQLAAHHQLLPLGGPTSFFWAAGLSSSVLDNAPCYLSFATLAAHHLGLRPASLVALVADPTGASYLEAVALGSVTMGAVTYVGNGPNLMVRSMAEHAGVRTPSFAAYLAWSACTLLPLLACVQWLLYTAMR